jgi:hypothetical protein
LVCINNPVMRVTTFQIHMQFIYKFSNIKLIIKQTNPYSLTLHQTMLVPLKHLGYHTCKRNQFDNPKYTIPRSQSQYQMQSQKN